MFVVKKIRDDLLVSSIGAVKHAVSWVLSDNGDLVYHNPAFRTPDPRSGVSPKGIAIYCIHGTADRVSAFKYVVNQIIDDLPDMISSIYLVSFEHRGVGMSIEDFSKQLRGKINYNQDEDIILMGHSRGGIVGANYAERYADVDKVHAHAVIGICSPYQGSDLAQPPLSWYSSSVKEMQRNSDFLKELHNKIRVSPRKYIYYGAANDYIVDSESACIPEHKNKLVVLGQHGHLSIMSSDPLPKLLQKNLIKITEKLSSVAQSIDDDDISQDQFVILDSETASPLENVCVDIDLAAEQLMMRYHLHSATEKETVLLKLLDILQQIQTDDKGEYYPEAHTVSDFIHAYLHDKAMGEGRQPIDILNDPLNYPFSTVSSVFKPAKPESASFVDRLLSEYKDKPLPSRMHAFEEDKKCVLRN